MVVDCAIIGGGPAGLTAALTLVRARRNVIVFDGNRGRNSASDHSHNYLTRDGTSPSELRELGRKDILKYPSAVFKDIPVRDITKNEKTFTVTTVDDETFEAKKILLATGVKDIFPDIKGMNSFWGKSVFTCPYCHGWEYRDQPLIVICDNPMLLFFFGKKAYNWSKDLLVCSNGKKALTDEQLEKLNRKGIQVTEQEIVAFEGKDTSLERVVFKDGTSVARSAALIFPARFEQASNFAEKFGCELLPLGMTTDPMGKTNVPGVFAAGDMIDIMRAQISVACAGGAKAAIGIDTELTEEEFIQ